jgi:hypothetical protein
MPQLISQEDVIGRHQSSRYEALWFGHISSVKLVPDDQ